MSASTIVQMEPSVGRMEALLESCQLTGFEDLEHLNRVSRRQELFSLLRKGSLLEGRPVRLSLMLLRAILIADEALVNARVLSSQHIRFGIHAKHLPQIREVSLEELQQATSYVRMHQDVPRNEIFDRSSSTTLIDWTGMSFYSIPPDVADVFWDLYRLEDSPGARPRTVVRPRLSPEPSTVQNEVRQGPRLVSANRGWPGPRIREKGQGSEGGFKAIQLVPLYPFWHPGSALELSVAILPVLEPKEGSLAAFHPALAAVRPLGSRELRSGEAWIILSYEAPTLFLSQVEQAQAEDRDPMLVGWDPAEDDLEVPEEVQEEISIPMELP